MRFFWFPLIITIGGCGFLFGRSYWPIESTAIIVTDQNRKQVIGAMDRSLDSIGFTSVSSATKGSDGKKRYWYSGEHHTYVSIVVESRKCLLFSTLVDNRSKEYSFARIVFNEVVEVLKNDAALNARMAKRCSP